jgi:hypothetical protein
VKYCVPRLLRRLTVKHLKRERDRRDAESDQFQPRELGNARRDRLVGEPDLLIVIDRKYLRIQLDKLLIAAANRASRLRIRLHRPGEHRLVAFRLPLLCAFEFEQQKIAQLLELVFAARDDGVADDDAIEQILDRLSKKRLGER